MIKVVEKLHFKPGDVLVLHHEAGTDLYAAEIAVNAVLDGLPFIVPYVFLAKGQEISKLSRRDLERVLRQLP
jgi:hypothetical protein|tara:strand:+ start:6822 stop:7037 length:216 start_codon:yes stop_codon:yes gene_type:complete